MNSQTPQEILEKARKYYETIVNYDIMEDIRPSRLWVEHTNTVLRKAMEQQNIVNIIHYFQENDGSTYGRFNTDANFYTTISKYGNWLKQNGLPVESLNMLVQESHLTSPKMMFNFEGRTVSTMFYWHLCACWRVLSFLKKSPRRTLEIGGGYGGFTRILKLLSPNTQIFILDLPTTLFFSYLFIASNFPESKILFVTEKDFTLQSKSLNSGFGADYDFVFIPISLIHTLFNESFDVVINTASLGEMSDRTVNRYMQFIQHDIHAKYFYSLNRYGRLRHTPRHVGGGTIGGEDGCKASVKLDPYWKTHLWDLYGKNSFSAIEGVTPPSLEILVERMSRNCLSDDYRLFVSNSLLQEAMLLQVQDDYWQRLMWESIRLYPNTNNLNFYLEFLEKQQYFEFHHYKELYEKVSSG